MISKHLVAIHSERKDCQLTLLCPKEVATLDLYGTWHTNAKQETLMWGKIEGELESEQIVKKGLSR